MSDSTVAFLTSIPLSIAMILVDLAITLMAIHPGAVPMWFNGLICVAKGMVLGTVCYRAMRWTFHDNA